MVGDAPTPRSEGRLVFGISFSVQQLHQARVLSRSEVPADYRPKLMFSTTVRLGLGKAGRKN